MKQAETDMMYYDISITKTWAGNNLSLKKVISTLVVTQNLRPRIICSTGRLVASLAENLTDSRFSPEQGSAELDSLNSTEQHWTNCPLSWDHLRWTNINWPQRASAAAVSAEPRRPAGPSTVSFEINRLVGGKQKLVSILALLKSLQCYPVIFPFLSTLILIYDIVCSCLWKGVKMMLHKYRKYIQQLLSQITGNARASP